MTTSRGRYAAFFFRQGLDASVAFLSLHAGSTHLVTIDITNTHAMSAVVLWVVQLASSPCACVPVKSSTIKVVAVLFLFEVPRTGFAVGASRRRDIPAPSPPSGLTPDAARLRTHGPFAPRRDHAIVRTWNMTRLLFVGFRLFQSAAFLVLHLLARQHVSDAIHGSRLNPIPARSAARLGNAVCKRRRVPKVTSWISALLRLFRPRAFGDAFFGFLNDAADARPITATVLLVAVDANLRFALAPLTPLAHDAFVGAENGAVAFGLGLLPRAFVVVHGSPSRFVDTKYGAKLTSAATNKVVKGVVIIADMVLFLLIVRRRSQSPLFAISLVVVIIIAVVIALTASVFLAFLRRRRRGFLQNPLINHAIGPVSRGPCVGRAVR